MDVWVVLKAGFMGFGLCVGALMLVFYIASGYVRISQGNFFKIFIVAGVFSFAMTAGLLYYKLVVSPVENLQFYATGCIGGWLSGITSGLTHMKRFLVNVRNL